MRSTANVLLRAALDEADSNGLVDLVATFAAPFAATITLDLLGLPQDDLTPFLDQFHSSPSDADEEDVRRRAYAEWVHRTGSLVAEIVGKRGQDPGDDLVSRLVTAKINGRDLTSNEVQGLVLALVVGGVHPLATAIAHSMATLGRDPSLRDALTAEPSKLAAVVEEFVRLSSPVAASARTALLPCVIDDTAIDAGERVLLLWVAANRDDDFANAEAVDLSRGPNRHVGFGFGPHRCIGAAVARAALRVAIEQILDELPPYVVVEGGIQTLPPGSLKGITYLPVRFIAPPKNDGTKPPSHG
jgi:cytochrome P450